ncbi:uncharacterized protein LOC122268061 isoform X2 [Penaeus japonicus]|uniref:uncharacterized protein LOC122268061 isoform X2 n=1 Tax=Penaeus japonicus TaxID=27405 RepID=UPI001C71655D|nr:uncharacterized protein LOC122268061 isoform X2 [Penaeus japonicus]
MSVLQLAILFMAWGTISCLHIYDECIPKHSQTVEIKGNTLYGRVWVPKNEEVEYLVLMSENEKTEAFRKIGISRTQVNVHYRTDAVVTDIRKTNVSISKGWTDFRVTLDNSLQFFLNEVSILNIEDNVKDNSLKIIGKHVTINCPTSMIQWEVTAHQNAIVPLDGPGPHHFAIYSREAFLPSLTISSQRLDLHLDPQSNTVSSFASNPLPLPAFTLYNFTLICRVLEYTTCDVLNGGDGPLVGSVLHRTKISLSFTTVNKNYIVVQNLPKDEEVEAERLKDENEKGCQEVLERGNLEDMWKIIFIVLICLLAVLVAAGICYFGKKHLEP